MSARKLKAWQQAGLIDADTAARIAAWEAENARPLGIWAMVGLGALAIGLGIVSVVAANWEAIPGEVRLAIHFVLMAAIAVFIWWREPKAADAPDYFSDALLLVAAVLGLTFFAHIGQVYQTSSPLWQPLLVWLLIYTPLLLMFGRGWPVAALWMAGVLGTAWAHGSDYDATLRSSGTQAYPALYWGLIASPPMIVAAFAAVMRERSVRPPFWRLIEQLAVIAILAGVSILIVARGWGIRSDHVAGSGAIHALFMIAAAAAIFAVRRTKSGQAMAGILVAAALIYFSQLSGITVRTPNEGPWIDALFFLALWGAVAYGALHAAWRGLFQGAIAIIAVRIIILSFEVSDDLLGSGVSLIISGIFAMGVAWTSIWISRRYAPAKAGEA